jgi:hypothetical protein
VGCRGGEGRGNGHSEVNKREETPEASIRAVFTTCGI